MVGVPAHKTKNALKESIEKKTFSAYGVDEENSDPIIYSVNKLLDHVQKLEKEIESLKGNQGTKPNSDLKEAQENLNEICLKDRSDKE